MSKEAKLNNLNLIKESFESGLSFFWLQSYRTFLDVIQKDFIKQYPDYSSSSNSEILHNCLDFLLYKLTECDEQLSSLKSRQRIFASEFAQETVAADRRNLLIEFCQYLGQSNLKNDKRALDRWLDEAAVIERWTSRVKDKEFYTAFIMGRINAVFDLIAYSPKAPNMAQVWKTRNFETNLSPWMRYSDEPKVQLAAFRCISGALKSSLSDDPNLLSSELQRYTYRFALDSQQQDELQIEALQLLAVADIKKAIALIRTRLDRENEGEQIFFREAISELICLHYLAEPQVFDLVDELLDDPSPLVRQSIIQTLAVCDDEEKQKQLISTLEKDKSDAVFCHLAAQLPFLIYFDYGLQFYLRNLSVSTSYVRIRALCRGLVSWIDSHSNKNPIEFAPVLAQCNECLTALSLRNESPKIQHLAVETREKVWAAGQIEFNEVLAPIVKNKSGTSIKLSEIQMLYLARPEAKRWLAANIGHNFSLEINNKKLLTGDRFGFRWWRFLHEFSNASTDKRQHHSHVVGRVHKGSEFVPSALLAEVSATRVPGEPLHFEQEGNWRPFLPLVDHLLSSLTLIFPRRPIKIYHATGCTEVEPPRGIWRRLKAKLTLNWKFERYAQMRNVDITQDACKQYTAAIKSLGFTIKHNGYELPEGEGTFPTIPAVSRFFDLAVPISVIQFYQDFQRYFVSVYQNTINHILVFCLLMVAIFWGNHMRLGRAIKQARAQIPVTIGGWGTRGKSGTERLKAALVNSLGLSIVSKTTGCEAMFLYATRYGRLKEMFLFRPYDKATIWEQTFVTRLAAKLNSDSLCWECMGLTPKYIDILQQQWMKDDLITITNCFPDHEDLQGPAGIDIPQVIAKFIAPKSRVWTSEENMLAYLEREAQQKQAQLSPVDWLKVATIPEDLLARFPYEEHPANIALVAELASEMRVKRSIAIKEMADRVIPDIGVLQVFPFAQVEGRKLRFINGMSANERYGALGNWNRLKYDELTQNYNGNRKLITVINNRADRVPRSKVFARLIAYDFSVHQHFVVGNNLDGFKMFAMEAWDERASESFPQGVNSNDFRRSLSALTRFLQVPQNFEQIIEQAKVLVPAIVTDSLTSIEEVAASVKRIEGQIENVASVQLLKQIVSYFEKYQSLLSTVSSNAADTVPTATINDAKSFLRQIFEQKITLIDDYYISGEELNSTIVRSLPTAFETDVLGLQNIKGPGLDFVYSWQQWQRIHDIVRHIETSHIEDAEKLMNELTSIPNFGALEHAFLEEFADAMESQQNLHSDNFTLMLDSIRHKNLSVDLSEKDTTSYFKWLEPFLKGLEEVVDIFDAIRRGRQAKKILIDLAAQRISLNKAAHLLMQINKRQKGGWLYKSS